jgi:hypothetical protein
MEMTALWDTVTCNVIELDLCFRGAHSLHHENCHIDYMFI